MGTIVIIVCCVLVVAAAALGITYFTVRAITGAQQTASTLSQAQEQNQAAAKFKPLEFPAASLTADALRPKLASWLESKLMADGLSDPVPEAIPASQWKALVQAYIWKETKAPEALSTQRLQSMGVEMLPVADKHPMAAYVVAQCLGQSHEASRPLLQKAYDGFAQKPGLSIPAYLAAVELVIHQNDDATETSVQRDVDQAVAALRKALAAEAGFSGLHDRTIAYLFYWGTRESFTEHAHEEVFEAVADAPQAKPWVKLWLEGIHHIRAAWDARGGGYADTVTDEGRRTFRKEIGLARTSLKAACDENPESAEPACQLVTCGMADSRNNVADMLAALGRATSVQVDHVDSYAKVLWGLYPRWHGSHAEMVKFGEACLASGRFDSEVPSMYLWAHREVSSEWDLPDAYFLEINDFTKFRQLFDGYEAEPARKPWREYDATIAAVVSYKCAQYEDAQRWVDKVNGKLNEAALESWGYSDAAPIVGKTAAFVGGKGAALRSAEKAEQSFQSAKALEIYRKTLTEDSTTLKPVGRAYLEQRRAATELEAALQGGKTYDLGAASTPSGWTRDGGGLRFLPDGVIEHGGAEQASVTTHYGRVGSRFIMEGELELPVPTVKSQAWIAFGYPEKLAANRVCAVRFVQGEDGRVHALLSTGFQEPTQDTVLEAAPTLKFTLATSPGGISLTVNGAEIWRGVPVPEGYVREQHSQIGLGALTPTPEARVRFRDLKIRRK